MCLRKLFLKKYKLEFLQKFYLALVLAWQAALKTNVKLDLLLISILIMVEEDITRETCHFIYQYEKANNKCIKNYDKNKEFSYL